MKRHRPAAIGMAAATALVLLISAACSSNNNAGSSTTTSAPTSSAAGGGTSGSETSPASSAAASSQASSGPAGSGESSAATSSAASSQQSSAASSLPPAHLTILFGSSGTAETNALKSAAAAWAKQSGSTVDVTAASNLQQQLAQGFSSNTPPDIFYVGADSLGTYAKAKNLWSYGDQLPNKGDFYPTLVQTFTYDNQLVCAPKDQSTLALFINTDDWKAAGLTDADIPTTWDQLATVAKKLSTGGRVGLALSPTRDRVNAFLVQNGGWLTNANQTKATVNSEQNIAALTYVKKLMTDGAMKWSSDLNTGWGGEAFGTNKAAMTIEGPWLLGPMQTDYAKVKYQVVPLPAGPTGTKGTLVFTNCWGIAAASKNHAQALNLVEYLTQPDVQMGFSKAFGVIPSVKTAQDSYLKEFPQNKVFVDGIAYAHGVVTAPGVTAVLTDMDNQLTTLASSDPKTILDSVQQNLAAALGG
jgi:multiple sugar transport system substrate-binding protein